MDLEFGRFFYPSLCAYSMGSGLCKIHTYSAFSSHPSHDPVHVQQNAEVNLTMYLEFGRCFTAMGNQLNSMAHVEVTLNKWILNLGDFLPNISCIYQSAFLQIPLSIQYGQYCVKTQTNIFIISIQLAPLPRSRPCTNHMAQNEDHEFGRFSTHHFGHTNQQCTMGCVKKNTAIFSIQASSTRTTVYVQTL